MSGARKIVQSENAKNNESQEQLAKDLMNTNEEAAKDEGGEYEKETDNKTASGK